jgi:ABC-type phosphate transport system substrate-binding protein
MSSKLLKSGLLVAALFAAPVAFAQVAVVMAPGSPALSKDQVANVYLGRSFDLKPIDQPESSAVRAQFYKKATDRDLAQVKATWSRIIFTGKGQPPKELPDDAAVKKAVAADPKAIGYIDKSAVDGSVKAVLILD